MRSKAVNKALSLVLGVALTMAASAPHSASAQESGVAEAHARTKASPASAEASLAYGQALRRAGREAEALTELRRGLASSGGRGEIAARVQWELARTFIARREFEPALATCRAMAKMPGADGASHVCAAEAHLLWRRGTEASAEIALIATKLRAVDRYTAIHRPHVLNAARGP